MSATPVGTGQLPSTARPSRVRIWIQAVRPFSFTAAIAPILVGTGLAIYHGAFDVVLFVAMLVASVLVQAGSNLANDYTDHMRGVDKSESLGPSGVIQRGYLTTEQVRRGMLVCFAIATVIGLGIVAATDWKIFLLALVCLALAYLYTGGPRPLGYIALGEVTVFVSMGLGIVMGSYYVYTGEVTWESFFVALPVALLVTAILHANNIRDIESDREAGKVTLANTLGRTGANWEYWLLVGLAYPALLLLVWADAGLWPAALLPILTLRKAIPLMKMYATEQDPQKLSLGLRKSAGLHLQFGFLLALGLLLAAALRHL